MNNTAPTNSSVPCLVCGKHLDDVFAGQGQNQPSDATMFTSHGNYGSTVFDPMNSGVYLEVNICDECLTVAATAGRVLHVSVERPLPVCTETVWRPGRAGSDTNDAPTSD